jgi:hypothetical protein
VSYPTALFCTQRDVKKKKRKEGGSIRTTLVPILLPAKRVVFPNFPRTLHPTFRFQLPHVSLPPKSRQSYHFAMCLPSETLKVLME